jgi:hypothetical protein
MLKKIILPLLVLIMCTASMSTVYAEQNQEIRVLLNEQELEFEAKPLLKEGTTLVPFRPIFEALGLKVAWDAETQTVSGANEETNIEFVIGNQTAKVNGQDKTLSLPSQMVEGRTYVPLRFVGEATGNEVLWDASTQTISINVVAKISKAELKQSVIDFLEKQLLLDNNENLEGYMATIHPKSPYYPVIEQMMPVQYKKHNLKNTYDQIEVIDINEKEATVQVIQTSVEKGEAFYLDKSAEAILTLLKVGDDWMLYNVQIVKVDYISPKEFYETEAEVTAELKAELKTLLETQHEATEKGSLEDVLATIDESSPAYQQSAQVYEFMLNTYTLSLELEVFTVLEVSENEAHVYAVETLKKLEGPNFQDYRAKSVHTLKKNAEGEWKLYQSEMIHVEPLAAESAETSK